MGVWRQALTHPHPSPLREGAYTRTNALPAPMMIAFALPSMVSVPTIIMPIAMVMSFGNNYAPTQYGGCQRCDDQFELHVRFLAPVVEVAYKITRAALNEC
jgi:hypothetical protein